MESFKSLLPRQILIFTGIAALFTVVGVLWSDTIYFLYMVWNIVLAVIPLLLSTYLLWRQKNNKGGRTMLITGFIVWFLFFPNAPYLFTDVIHVGENSIVPLWYDATIFVSGEVAGMMVGIYSLMQMEQFLLLRFSRKTAEISLFVITLASSFGIYLGRFLRWNTWDILFSPGSMGKDITQIFLHPVYNLDAYTFTFAFFILIYLSFSWSKRKMSYPKA